MTDQSTGADLARQALAAWKATAKTRPATGATKPRKKRRAQYGDGRDPVGLGSVLGQISAENEWKTAVAGGSILDRWAELCPELVGKVAPETFDAPTGRLHLRPASPTYATHLRMLGPQLVARLQAKGVPVRTIRVLAPGVLATAAPATPGSPTPAPEPPPKTRTEASAGYRTALEAHHAHVVTDHGRTDLQAAIRAAAARPPLLREPDHEFADARAFREDLEERAATSRDSRARALQIARAQKAGRAPAVPTVFQRSA
ncbi:DciA family protein [Streptomyces lydicus]|uniref:DciA family protein n=1 Tax=Streptomyces lydicus TaxID=47763 RepID=UPI0037A6F5A0